jgi:hypothetical protein
MEPGRRVTQLAAPDFSSGRIVLRTDASKGSKHLSEDEEG